MRCRHLAAVGAAAILCLSVFVPMGAEYKVFPFGQYSQESDNDSSSENLRKWMKARRVNCTHNDSDSICNYVSCNSSPRRPKYILVWSEYSIHFDLGFGRQEGDDVFERHGCQPSDCVLTSNRFLMPLELFDAIIIEVFELWWNELRKLPRQRSCYQRYVFYSWETPFYTRSIMPMMDDLFNWTMTYRKDSDIEHPYGRLVPRPGVRVPAMGWITPPKLDYSPEDAANTTLPPLIHRWSRQGLADRRSPRAAWLVSHCSSSGLRERLVKLLSHHMEVRIFGSCGPDGINLPNADIHDFYEMLDEQFDFYLSFENSLCKDYITEKLFNILRLKNVVPVVYGGANYSAVLPPYSYIDARAFASPRHLAEYLRHLAHTPKEFEKFFWWKKYYMLGDAVSTIPMCKLCALLHGQRPSKWYSNIEQWWEKDSCFKPQF